MLYYFLPWNVEYYKSASGKYPVGEFIDSLEVKSQTRIARTLELLEEFGIEMGMPYTRYLEKQLWELRIRLGRIGFESYIFCTPGKPLSCSMDFPKRPMPCTERI
jgi:hypothetical protein